MKKLLLASTILGMTAGVAAAEITMTGDARMGLINDFGSTTDTAFTSRARVTFNLSGESDTGFAFGASFRADNAGGAASGTAGSVFISGAFGKLSMGDVDGAAQMAVGQPDGVGLTGLGDLNELSFIGAGGTSPVGLDYGFFTVGGGVNPATGAPWASLNGDPTLLYEYSNGSLSAYGSVSQLNYTFDENGPAGGGVFIDAVSMAAGAAYAANGYKFALGYERWDGTRAATDVSLDNLVVGADATLGPVTVKARYASGASTYAGIDFQDNDQWSLSATYAQNGLSLTGFASEKQFSSSATGANTFTREALGLGASYDLGGGAKVVGGVVRRGDTTGAAAKVKDTAADIGLSFSF